MPLIKPETRSGVEIFLSTRRGESVFILLLGGAIWTVWIYITGSLLIYVSDLLYPFTYIFFPLPIYEYLPDTVIIPKPLAGYFFGALFIFCIYRFEKNIFFRRINLALKAFFAAVGASAFVFISSFAVIIISGFGFPTIEFIFPEAAPIELPALFVTYFLYSLPIIKICDLIRRRIFLLP